MKKTVHLVQPSSIPGKTKYISVFLDGSKMHRKWGLIGGAEQETPPHQYKPINKGKSNEQSAEVAAQADFDRLLKKKIKEGYRETDTLTNGHTDAKLDTMDFDNPPKSFSPSKPVKKISDAALEKMMKKGTVMFQEKENGLCHWIFVNSKGNVHIYTRRMDDHTRKYPGLVEALNKYKLPPKTVLGVELVVDGDKGWTHLERFRCMQSISKSDVSGGTVAKVLTKTLEKQKKHPVRSMVFHILYLNGSPLWKEPYGEVYKQIDGFFYPKTKGSTFFQPTIRPEFKSAEEARAFVEETKRVNEGLVAWDLTACLEVDFRGKPKRRASYKMKLPLETDVIVYGYEEGTGENQGKIGALLIAQMKDGKQVECGKCGGGLSDELRNLKHWTFPCVIEIEYDERFASGKFQFPRLSRKHPDKTPEECDWEG